MLVVLFAMCFDCNACKLSLVEMASVMIREAGPVVDFEN